MTDTAKPPYGNYVLHDDPENPNEAFVLYANGYAAFHGSSYGRTERAKLLVEAGTVFNETGLTPRQLVEQRDWLRNALQHIAGSCGDYAKEVATAALAKVEAKP